MLQKVQLLAAVIHQPDLLILDEPFSGLDPVSARLLRDLILGEHRRGATILFSTHVMPHAEEICQNVVMIHQGRKVLDEPLSAIRQQYDPLSPDGPGHFDVVFAQVAVVPGTSHGLPLEKPGLGNSLLLDFLADPQPPKFMPLGDLNP